MGEVICGLVVEKAKRKEMGVGTSVFLFKYICVLISHRRKRGEKGEVVETVEDVIVRKLTAERVEELKKVIKETQEKYRYLPEMSDGWERQKALISNIGQDFLSIRLKTQSSPDWCDLVD